MEIKHKVAFYIILTFSIFLTTSCNTSINDMLNDYNQNFTEDTSERDKITHSPVPGDDDFTPSGMLEDEYFVWDDATLNLSAPAGCSTYLWEFIDPEEDSLVAVHYYSTKSGIYYKNWKDKELYINISESGLQTSKVYKLKLTVVSKEEDTYTDTAAVVIYDHLYL